MQVSQSELRLVVLGGTRGGSGTGNHPVCTILGLQGAEPPPAQQCSKHRGQAAGRQVVLVSTPAWFSGSCPPEQRSRIISSMISLSSPGPHAFLLCVPLSRRADGESAALDVLQELLGASAVASNTVVLFTHVEELQEDESLEEFLFTWRKDLLELVGRCGERYHALGGVGAVEQLLERVERGTAERLSCPLYQEAERRLRARQVEIARRRSGEERRVTEEELEAARDEAERSLTGLDVHVEHLFPSAAAPPPPAAPSSLWAWMQWLARLVRREALLGALVGLFVGGPVGGVVGASVGSVATEVQRRRSQKTK